MAILLGCGSGLRIVSVTSTAHADKITITPTKPVLSVGLQYQFSATTNVPCQWLSSDSSIFEPLSTGAFFALAPGSATITAQCADDTASQSLTISASTVATPPIVITSGGTYMGNWISTDPTIPAVTIATDAPVTINNSTVAGPGHLIVVNGRNHAQVTLTSITGTAIDPGLAGKSRGQFLLATGLSSLSVDHCTMSGVSLGIDLRGSVLTKLSITNNAAFNMEDRNSNGNGGFVQPRTTLGHFIILNNVVASNGSEIAWNQLINTPGHASMEDAVNFFQSSGGSTSLPIAMHDNYLQGIFASGQTKVYTGSGVITDGASNDAPGRVTAYISIFDNSIVQTQNGGIALAAGHDNLVTNNRIVSCGKDAMGNWIAGTDYGDALGL